MALGRYKLSYQSCLHKSLLYGTREGYYSVPHKTTPPIYQRTILAKAPFFSETDELHIRKTAYWETRLKESTDSVRSSLYIKEK